MLSRPQTLVAAFHGHGAHAGGGRPFEDHTPAGGMAGMAGGGMGLRKHYGPLQVCRDYTRGVCHRGSRCKYVHVHESALAAHKQTYNPLGRGPGGAPMDPEEHRQAWLRVQFEQQQRKCDAEDRAAAEELRRQQWQSQGQQGQQPPPLGGGEAPAAASEHDSQRSPPPQQQGQLPPQQHDAAHPQSGFWWKG